MKRNTKSLLLLSSFAVFGLAFNVHANDKNLIEGFEGTSQAEIDGLKPLAQPKTLKVAILPFSATSSDPLHVRSATSANWLLFERHGFQMQPISSGFEAVRRDEEVEPGLPLRKSDAARIGKKMGVDWVVYGEVKELRPYKKRTFFKEMKLLWASMRIAVFDIQKNDLIFWQVGSRRIGGTGFQVGFQSKAEQLMRVGVVSVSDKALEPLFKALPEHEIKGKLPESGDIAKFVSENWSEKK